MRIFCRRIIILVALFVQSHLNILCAQEVQWTKISKKINITNYTQIFKGELMFEDLLNNPDSLNLSQKNGGILNFGFTDDYYWIKFKINNSSNERTFLELNNSFIPEIELFYINSSNEIQRHISGYKVRLDQKDVYDNKQVFEIGSGNCDYYLRIKPLLHPFSLLLWSEKEFLKDRANSNFVIGLIIGTLLLIFFISLLLSTIFKIPYFLTYSILVFLYIISITFVLEGSGIYLFPDIDLMFFFKIVPVLNMPVLILYLISFLKIKQYSKKLYDFSIKLCIGLGFYILLIPILNIFIPLVLNLLLALGVFIFAIYLGYFASVRGKNRMGHYFILSYSIWFILLFLEESNIQFGYPKHLFSISYVTLAMFIESIILAFLLVLQIRNEKINYENENLKAKLNLIEAKKDFEIELFNSRIETQEQTLRNISQELHDNISQKLGLAKLQLNQLQTMQPGADVGPTKSVISDAIADIRSLSKSLHPDRISSIPLKESIEHEINLLRHASPATFTCNIEQDSEALTPDQRIILFRIFQELLNNALKYAHASAIEVLLATNGNITLSVMDNGTGLPPDYQKGIGHTSIQNRVTLLKGSFHLESIPGKGTVAKVKIPINI